MPAELLEFQIKNMSKSPVEKLNLFVQLFNQYGDLRAQAIDDANFLNRIDYAKMYGIVEQQMWWLYNELLKVYGDLKNESIS